jgi:hypothetical protein
MSPLYSFPYAPLETCPLAPDLLPTDTVRFFPEYKFVAYSKYVYNHTTPFETIISFRHVESLLTRYCTYIVYKFWYFADRASQYIYLNINQLDALNFIMSLFRASTCFEHTCSSSGGQNCTIQPLVSSHL